MKEVIYYEAKNGTVFTKKSKALIEDAIQSVVDTIPTCDWRNNEIDFDNPRELAEWILQNASIFYAKMNEIMDASTNQE